ncbi:DUF47 family protein [Candidatus Bathyarchaeota archaeon]|nr:DUF47 family protein [Candidatus Bathyarchaeota archaeon]
MRIPKLSFPLIGRKERTILRLLNEYMDLIIEVIDELGSLISLLKEESTHELSRIIRTKIEMISIREAFADETNLKLLVAICEGAFFSDLREDFLDFIKNVDDIADFAKKSSQILVRTQLNWIIRRLYESSDIPLDAFLNKITKSVKSLKEALQEVERNVEHTIAKAIEVKEIEEEADDAKWKLLEIVFSYRSEIDTLTLIELKDFLLTLDEIIDAAARSSEALIKIVTKVRA